QRPPNQPRTPYPAPRSPDGQNLQNEPTTMGRGCDRPNPRGPIDGWAVAFEGRSDRDCWVEPQSIEARPTATAEAPGGSSAGAGSGIGNHSRGRPKRFFARSVPDLRASCRTRSMANNPQGRSAPGSQSVSGSRWNLSS